MNKLKNVKKTFLISLLASLILTTLIMLTMIKTESNRTPVSQVRLTQAKSLVFYRDDCPKCRQHFLGYYLKSVVDDGYVLVNVNNQINAKVARQYHVEHVPTIIKKEK